MAIRPLPTVPCHNDLLAENYLDDGERLWIVDYEYSGNNDPTFELGNTCQELGFGDERIAELCAAYFGEASPALLARMRLQMIMSDVGWTLWAAIQARISTIDYDFTGWAEERWGRASAALDGPRFGGGCGVREADLSRASARHQGRPGHLARSPTGTRSSKTSTLSGPSPRQATGQANPIVHDIGRSVATLRSRPITSPSRRTASPP